MRLERTTENGGCADTRKKAKKENWQHDLAERVRQRIREKSDALDAIEAKRAHARGGW